MRPCPPLRPDASKLKDGFGQTAQSAGTVPPDDRLHGCASHHRTSDYPDGIHVARTRRAGVDPRMRFAWRRARSEDTATQAPGTRPGEVVDEAGDRRGETSRITDGDGGTFVSRVRRQRTRDVVFAR